MAKNIFMVLNWWSPTDSDRNVLTVNKYRHYKTRLFGFTFISKPLTGPYLFEYITIKSLVYSIIFFTTSKNEKNIQPVEQVRWNFFRTFCSEFQQLNSWRPVLLSWQRSTNEYCLSVPLFGRKAKRKRKTRWKKMSYPQYETNLLKL